MPNWLIFSITLEVHLTGMGINIQKYVLGLTLISLAGRVGRASLYVGTPGVQINRWKNYSQKNSNQVEVLQVKHKISLSISL